MIDRARLSELKEEIGEEDFAEVAEIFLDEMNETLSVLSADPAAITAAAFHGLRGTASNLGFAGFAVACSGAEQLCRAGEAVEIAPLIALFRASVEAAGGQLPAMAA